MLHDFISAHREQLIARAAAKAAARTSLSSQEPEDGVPAFLAQVAETLRLEVTETPFPGSAIGAGAARHGRELLARGYSISQVVHDYADVCQAVTELAVTEGASITPAEFHTLNRCLDTAIAE